MSKLTKVEYYNQLLDQTNLEVRAHQKNISPGRPVDHVYEEKLKRFNDLLTHGFNGFLDLDWVDETVLDEEQHSRYSDGKRIITPTPAVEEEVEEFICMLDGEATRHKTAEECANVGGTWTLVE